MSYSARKPPSQSWCGHDPVTSNSAVLDSGASATVAGKLWFDSFYEGMDKEQQSKVKYSESARSFKFGSGDSYKSLH